jgi:chromosome partitioning protein
MHTVVLATQKGGSGKTTLAIGLALAAQQAGLNVRLIETDPQGTLSNWQYRRGLVEPVVEPVYSADGIERRLQALQRGGISLAVIDTASGQSAATAAAIRHADLCLIPSRPCVADIEATAATLRIARACRTRFAFVLNQTPIRGQRLLTSARALGDAVSPEFADILAEPFVAMRNDHQDSIGAGLAVSEYAPDGKASDEIRELWQWVAARLGYAMASNMAATMVADEGGSAPSLRPATAPSGAVERATPVYVWHNRVDAAPTWDACL